MPSTEGNVCAKSSQLKKLPRTVLFWLICSQGELFWLLTINIWNINNNLNNIHIASLWQNNDNDKSYMTTFLFRTMHCSRFSMLKRYNIILSVIVLRKIEGIKWWGSPNRLGTWIGYWPSPAHIPGNATGHRADWQRLNPSGYAPTVWAKKTEKTSSIFAIFSIVLRLDRWS